MKTCIECEKGFESIYRNQKYCSIECRNRRAKYIRKANYLRRFRRTICKYCGRAGRGLICFDCRKRQKEQKNKRRNRWQEDRGQKEQEGSGLVFSDIGEKRQCAICDKDFVVQYFVYGKRQVRCFECIKQGKKGGSLWPYFCSLCRKRFLAPQGSKGQRWCPACRKKKKKCLLCGRKFKPYNSRQRLCKKCRKRFPSFCLSVCLSCKRTFFSFTGGWSYCRECKAKGIKKFCLACGIPFRDTGPNVQRKFCSRIYCKMERHRKRSICKSCGKKREGSVCLKCKIESWRRKQKEKREKQKRKKYKKTICKSCGKRGEGTICPRCQVEERKRKKEKQEEKRKREYFGKYSGKYFKKTICKYCGRKSKGKICFECRIKNTEESKERAKEKRFEKTVCKVCGEKGRGLICPKCRIEKHKRKEERQEEKEIKNLKDKLPFWLRHWDTDKK